MAKKKITPAIGKRIIELRADMNNIYTFNEIASLILKEFKVNVTSIAVGNFYRNYLTEHAENVVLTSSHKASSENNTTDSSSATQEVSNEMESTKTTNQDIVKGKLATLKADKLKANNTNPFKAKSLTADELASLNDEIK